MRNLPKRLVAGYTFIFGGHIQGDFCMPRKPPRDTSETSVIDLGALASKKNFDSYYDHPYTEEQEIPFFNFLSQKGKGAAVVVVGTASSEDVILSEYDDQAEMAGGDDIAVGGPGNDTISGGSDNDFLFGDTDLGIGNVDWDVDDVLNGDEGEDLIYGDAPNLFDNAIGGADTLTGGTGDDTLWGDGHLWDAAVGGADVFVFEPGSGNDVVMDFRQGDGDVIDVSGYGFDDIGDVNITDLGESTLVEFGGPGAAASVELLNFADSSFLAVDDFVFA